VKARKEPRRAHRGISINNKVEVVRRLDQLLDDAVKSKSAIGSLLEYPMRYEKLFNALRKTPYLACNYDTEAIADILAYTHSTKAPSSGTAFLSGFARNLSRTYNEWLAIFPLDYPALQVGLPRRRVSKSNFGDFIVRGAFETCARLRDCLKSSYQTPEPDDVTLKHLKTTAGDYLLQKPTLIFPMHGAYEVVRWRAQNHFSRFKALQDMFTAHLLKRWAFFDTRWQPPRHFFLSNRKTGDLRRLPLNVSTRMRVVFDGKMRRTLRQNGFSESLNWLLIPNPDRLTTRMNAALHIFSKGFNENDSLSEFLFYVIAAEALFSRSKDMPIQATLADHIALLARPVSRRAEIHSAVKEIYSQRSRVVHGGKGYVDPDTVNRAHKLVAMALFESLKVAKALDGDINREDAFFSAFLQAKLGIRKTVRA